MFSSSSSSASSSSDDEEEQAAAISAYSAQELEPFEKSHVELEVGGTLQEWARLCRLIAISKGVSRLWISINHDAAMQHLTLLKEALKQNQAIKDLWIMEGESGSELQDFDEAIRGLSVNKSIETLDYSDRSVTSVTAGVVGHSRTLKDLRCHVDHEGMEPLAQALKLNKSLKQVSLWLEPIVRSQHMLPFASLFDHNHTIEAFQISHDDEAPYPVDVSCFFRGLVSNTILKTFELENCTLSGPTLCDVLMVNQTLKALRIEIRDKKTITYLAQGLRKNTALESLKLKFCSDWRNMVEEVFAVIFDALAGASSGLKSLSVNFPYGGFQSRNEVVPADAIARVQDLVRSCKVLQKLELRQYAIDPQDDEVWQETLDAVLPGLCGSSIQSLSLDRLDEVTAPQFISVITNETCSLRSFELHRASESVTSAIAEAVQDSTLKELKLNGSEISPAAAGLLASSGLKVLDLYPIRGSIITAMSASIADGRSSLETLRLSIYETANSELEALIRVIPYIPSLKNLVLSGYRLPDDSARFLGEMLPDTTALKSIKLERGCLDNVTREHLGTLLAGLENNTSIEEFAGIPYHAEQMKADYYAALNRADRKTYLETVNMRDQDWVKAVGWFESCGGLSGLYFALRSKPDSVHRRPDSTTNPLGKRKRDDPY